MVRVAEYVMVTRDSHRLANEPDSRESDTDSQGGPHMVRVAESMMVTRDSHRLANEPERRESDTDSHRNDASLSDTYGYSECSEKTCYNVSCDMPG